MCDHKSVSVKRKGGSRPEGMVESRFEINRKKGEEEEEEGKGEEGLCRSVFSVPIL